MTPYLDTQTYNKAKQYKPGHGYQLRVGQPSAIVIHSTNNSHRLTPFAGEAKFLYESADVSAHFLISREGLIARFLEPGPWAAWHAGNALPAFLNSHSVGIELHHSIGDPPYPQAQIDALTWLCRDLIASFHVIEARIDTHRRIALPRGRKSDPDGWDDTSFYAWRRALYGPLAWGERLRQATGL